jgi:RHH-type proline utilization regulon transcriptional repressor/proline dehydrogenase/delta 1-pyrroline-5-carboxylate dehydrogenase
MNGIPSLKKRLVLEQWQISYYIEFESLLFANSLLNPELMKILTIVEKGELSKGFLREVVIDGFPFLCGVRPEEKSLYLGTRRLSRELSLLSIQESGKIPTDPETEKQLFLLRDHVEKISSLPVQNSPSEIEWITLENSLPDFLNKSLWKDVEDLSGVKLKKLIKKVSQYKSSLFEKFSDYGLSLTAQFDLIRVHLLKFLALLPSLDHDKEGREVKRNLLESLRRLIEDSRAISLQEKKGTRALPFSLVIVFSAALQIGAFVPPKLLSGIIRFMVKMMAKRFIAGESISTSHKTLRQLRATNRQATLDQLGELVVSAREADEYFEKVLHLIHGLKEHIPRGEKNQAGLYLSHVSIKVSALSHDFRSEAYEATYAKVAPRLKRILLEANREEVFINIDAEHYHYRDLVLKIYGEVLLETLELKNYSQTGIVVQAYLRDGASHLMDVVNLAKRRGIRMPIRLVKGAYWDAETIEGEAHQFSPPQFLNKEESDLHFRQLVYLSLKHHDYIHLAIGSHNLQDHSFVEALRELRFPSAPVIEHQCLHMTYEALSHGLSKMNWPTRNYMPIGNLLVGMAYLVRRIMENSSQVGVLSIMRSHQKANGFIPPADVHLKNKKEGLLHYDSFISKLSSDFTPTRPLRMSIEHELKSFKNEVSLSLTRFTEKQEEFKNSSDTKIYCSSKPDFILGTIKENTPEEALLSVDAVQDGLRKTSWGKKTNTLCRISVMLKASDLMLMRRNKLAALMVYEAGKTMREALADVDEAIDFINFYAREELRLQTSQTSYTNRGVFAVIAPWNFPLAIPCGMAVAALVAGNGVILKPAEQTPLIAVELYHLLLEAGIPQEVFSLICGDGEKVGSSLVSSEKVSGVVFTGSKNVGSWIYKTAAKKIVFHDDHKTPMQKKVITEMGGKNAVIVTNNCELDETISGIIYSAFGHAGQKCSAASRIIVHKDVKEALVVRLTEALKDLKVGESLNPETSISPLISLQDQQRVRKAVSDAKDEVIRCGGKIHLDRSFERLPGFCVGPTLLELSFHQAMKKDSWAQKEIFGPVLHVMEYESLFEAVELFNSTEYALTGGVFSQSQDDIDFLLKFLKAGNIYVNRPNTGARVGIEPFGGFKLSGTGPKAGGRDYLKEFHFIRPLERNPKKNDVHWASDSGYELLSPKSSFTTAAASLSRIERFSELLFKELDFFTLKLSDKDKQQLKTFVTFLQNHLNDYLKGRELNLVIPGQLSYNDKSLTKDAGLFVNLDSSPDLKCLYYLVSALSLGVGISVVCVTDESYHTWKRILDIVWKSGFSKLNIDGTFMSPQSLEGLLKKSDYDFIYAEKYEDFGDVIYKEILGGEALSLGMRSILSEIDGVSLDHPVDVLNQFVWTRSMAINTMRHGAPLEFNS